MTGHVSWDLAETPKNMFLRLFWYTRGKGTQDLAVVEELLFDAPRARERRPFRLRLPERPYSFTGNLIALIWALELGGEGIQQAVQQEIVVSPHDSAVRLAGDPLPEHERPQ
ncbi:MAG: hypothetical protein ACOZF0_18875 [Thermodesulfobacteriota bacterium]